MGWVDLHPVGVVRVFFFFRLIFFAKAAARNYCSSALIWLNACLMKIDMIRSHAVKLNFELFSSVLSLTWTNPTLRGTLVIPNVTGDFPSISDLKKKLESVVVTEKIAAMKTIIAWMLNGERVGGLLMHVIRFAATSSDHHLKKILMIYWENVDKRAPDGKALAEMILMSCEDCF